MSADSYIARLQAQIDQYRDGANIHDLPDIFHYWSNKHLRPRLNQVMGADSIVDFYALPFAKALVSCGENRKLLSLGAADCSVEIGVAKRLLELGHENFELSCYEVSPHLLERAEAAVEKEGLRRLLKLHGIDINRWKPKDRFAGVMANHSLHHFVELEQIFAGVYAALEDRGFFVTNDMIGRNGHMRWPEVLEFIDAIWAFMPDRYKFNRQLNRFEQTFVNWDCSNEGFEGIRAQDILPLLNRTFGFESFLAFGGIVDVFVDRAFGHNFDPNLSSDKAFIDFLQLLNDRLIEASVVKPTTMFAVMRKQFGMTPRVWRNWTPAFCERPIAIGSGR
ncbi:MAG TPA: class I SAM-dependent methyltransferase [Candidatus Acidoferrales bacterium]|nr:class I SAM-dependent methyltransferase [Candidatus Acidoferrales bacterium]